jgi:hypothetical protein
MEIPDGAQSRLDVESGVFKVTPTMIKRAKRIEKSM